MIEFLEWGMIISLGIILILGLGQGITDHLARRRNRRK